MDRYDELWQSILYDLEKIYNEEIYSEVFEPIKQVHSEKNGLLYVVVPNDFIKGRIDRLYQNRINDLIPRHTKESLRFKFITEKEIPKSEEEELRKERIIETTYRPGNIKASFSFDNFIVGESNFFAYKMANKVADQLGEVANPLYIFGDVGLGKTHLMQAIGNYVLDKDVNSKILYIQSGTFLEDFVNLSREKKIHLFLDKYRDIDVLLIDDIQILGGKEKTQGEFFKLYDLLFQQNKQIVITSDQPAVELKEFPERLKSRFQQGTTVNIGIPNLVHRISILKMKMKSDFPECYHLPEDVLEFIAENFQTNIRELYGALNVVINYYMLLSLSPTIDMAKEALAPLLKTRKKSKSISENNYDKIQSIVADYFQITVDELIGHKRNHKLAKARHIAMYLIKNSYDIPYKTIGELFGGKNHSTVLAAVEKIEFELKTDEQLQSAITTITKKIK